MNRRLLQGLCCIALIAFAASCGTRRNRRADNNYPPVKLDIQNLNFYDATVYLIWRSDRRRLGIVGGNSRQSFTSQWYGPELQVELQMLAGTRVRGDRVGVNPGDEFVIEIPSDPNRLRIYRR